MSRYWSLLKNAWLILWNLALLALVVGVPVVALWRGKWLAAVFMLGLAFAYWLWRHPAFILGMKIGRD